MKWISLLIALYSTQAIASTPKANILIDLGFAKGLGLKVLQSDSELNLAVAQVPEQQLHDIAHRAHDLRKCGGFELLSTGDSTGELQVYSDIFTDVRKHHQKQELYSQTSPMNLVLQKNESISEAITQLSESELQKWVEYLVSFGTRFHAGQNDPNKHVLGLKGKLEDLAIKAPFPVSVELVDHKSTRQKTLKFRIEGRERPDETVVLGGHLDSITWSRLGPAPGADDNASGSSNLISVVDVLLKGQQPQRSIEFFWYAGEEGGLLGSAEIAQSYKNQSRRVIGVMQLDMTLFPGSGELVIGNVSDFTSAWLREYLEELNRLYVGARFIDDKCGYACSDHASWYRQGFPTVMPFEAATSTMNRSIHTPQDVISNRTSFRHSLAFSQLAVAFAMDLANSNREQPY